MVVITAWVHRHSFIIPEGIVLGSDGSLYVADTGNNLIRRVRPDGIITTVAGDGTDGYGGDGGLAINAQLSGPTGLAVGQDGNLYIADNGNSRIRRVDPDGIITTVAGDGTFDYGGDGGQATQAQLASPNDIALGTDGTLYIADSYNNRIRRVGPDGIITTVAGDGTDGYGGDGGPAAQAPLSRPNGIAIGPDGNLYIADTGNGRIRQVGLDGIITTVAGAGELGANGDGGLATQARLTGAKDIAIGRDGSLYIASNEIEIGTIRKVGVNGIITTVAGTGLDSDSSDNIPASRAYLQSAASVALGPDNRVYLSDSLSHRIRRVGPTTLAEEASSLDGQLLYSFDTHGRHLQTRDAITGVPLYTFAYDPKGLLSSIIDLDGNTTRIERDSVGKPVAIVAPDGQRTALALDANGYLASVANPAGEVHRMAYTTGGLMTQFIDPKGNANLFVYDSLGFLLKDTNASGGGWNLARIPHENGFTSAMTTAEGRTSSFQVTPLLTGDREQFNIYPDGTAETTVYKSNGEEAITSADQTLTTLLQGPDPRFGMQAPIRLQLSSNCRAASVRPRAPRVRQR